MAFTKEDFNNPLEMFDVRTRQLRVRIQKLQNYNALRHHPFTKAVLKQEIDKAVDEYVARAIQKGD